MVRCCDFVIFFFFWVLLYKLYIEWSLFAPALHMSFPRFGLSSRLTQLFRHIMAGGFLHGRILFKTHSRARERMADSRVRRPRRITILASRVGKCTIQIVADESSI